MLSYQELLHPGPCLVLTPSYQALAFWINAQLLCRPGLTRFWVMFTKTGNMVLEWLSA